MAKDLAQYNANNDTWFILGEIKPREILNKYDKRILKVSDFIKTKKSLTERIKLFFHGCKFVQISERKIVGLFLGDTTTFRAKFMCKFCGQITEHQWESEF